MNTARRPSVVVTHPGSQQVYETVRGLQDARMLHRFVASVYWTHDRPDARLPYRYLPRPLRSAAVRGLRKRWHPAIDARYVREIPSPFLAMRGVAVALERTGLGRYAGIERLGDAWFDRAAASWLAGRRGVTQVHAFEGEALHTFRAARRRGMKTVLDAPAAHEYNLRLCAAEAAAQGVPARVRFGSATRIAEERALADVVVSPSAFVTRCLVDHGVPESRIAQVPFGADVAQFSPAANDDAFRDRAPFRLLCVASINYRKGTRYLLEAWRQLALPGSELVLAGTPDDAGRALLREYQGTARLIGHVPWFELPDLFRSASAFVLPSIAEGSALVTYMAMASGLPVIVTEDAGSVARDGIDGIVVPSRDVEALKHAIVRLYEHRGDARAMGASGRTLIEQRYTWRHYHARIAALHQALYEGRNPVAAVDDGAFATPREASA
jgi:glycosyltransferase involved in cell wall biosynthesis